jgi:hypothetical protein
LLENFKENLRTIPFSCPYFLTKLMGQNNRPYF